MKLTIQSYNSIMKEIRNNNIKSSSNTDCRLVEGYAVVFNSRSVDLGGFYEVIDKNALDGVLEISDVLCLLDHNTNRGVLARSRQGEGSLNLTVDDYGLFFSFEAPNTALGDEILEGVKRGDISSCSFAFTVDEDEYTKEADGVIIRTVKKINKLFDISLVYNPAYESTNVDTRGFDDFMRNNNDNNMTDDKEIQDKETEEDVKEKENEKDTETNSCGENDEEVEKKSEEEETDEESEDKEDTENKESEEKPQDEDVEEKEDDMSDEDVEKDEDEVDENVKKDDKEQRKLNKKTNKKENRNNKFIMKKNFRLIDAINDVVNNRSFGEGAKDVIARSKQIASKNGIDYGASQIVLATEMRAEGDAATPNGILAGTDTYGKEVVPNDLFDVVGALRDKMVLAEAGARFINATGNVDVPVYEGSTCDWADEIGEAVDGTGKFTTVKVTPKRLTAVLPISRTFLAQTSDSAEAMLRDDLVNAITEKLQQTILGDGEGSDVEPAGIFADADTLTDEITYADVLDIEEELEEGNFNTDAAKWVISPAAKAILRNTKLDNGSGRFVMEEGEILGVEAHATNSVVKKGIAYGDFSELLIFNWGAMDVMVDPYSLAAKNQIRLVVHFYVNYVVRREDAIVKKILK